MFGEFITGPLLRANNLHLHGKIPLLDLPNHTLILNLLPDEQPRLLHLLLASLGNNIRYHLHSLILLGFGRTDKSAAFPFRPIQQKQVLKVQHILEFIDEAGSGEGELKLDLLALAGPLGQ